MQLAVTIYKLTQTLSLSLVCQKQPVFNTSKCVLVRFFSSPSSTTCAYTINGAHLTEQDSHRDLDIHLSKDLTCSSHYHYICARAYKTLGLLKHTFSSSLPVHTKKLYIALASQISTVVLLTNLESTPNKKHCKLLENPKKGHKIHSWNSFIKV